MKKNRSKHVIFCLWCAFFVATLFLSGCHTLEGMKQDWQTATDWDKEFQKTLW